MQKNLLVEGVDVIRHLHRTTHVIAVPALAAAAPAAVLVTHAGVVAAVNLFIMCILCYIYYHICV